jgi:cell division protein FtsB
MPGHARAMEGWEGSAKVELLPTEVLMQWFLWLLLAGASSYEFHRIAKHLNKLKDDYDRLADEFKKLKQRVGWLEDDDD